MKTELLSRSPSVWERIIGKCHTFTNAFCNPSMSDMQWRHVINLSRSISLLFSIDEECLNDGFQYTPKSLFSWLTRVMYNRRTRFNPLWNTLIVGGLQDGEPFLGYVDKIGTAYQSNTVASGFGAYIAQVSNIQL